MGEYTSIGELAMNWIFWFVLGTSVSFIMMAVLDKFYDPNKD
jgi:hypothetical protein